MRRAAPPETRDVRVAVTTGHAFHLELLATPEGGGAPLSRLDLREDLAGVVEEAFVSGVLGGALPAEAETVRAEVRPIWSERPRVTRLEVRVEAECNGATHVHRESFGGKRFESQALRAAAELRQQGVLGREATAYRALVAHPIQGEAPDHAAWSVCLDPLLFMDGGLEAAGVGALSDGRLLPDRPVLVHHQLVTQILDWTARAGVIETGGAVLGRMIRLPAPLPGTRTRIVTQLTAAFQDTRHVGQALKFAFDPGALAGAAQIATDRGCGESVLTVFHSHGWQPGCAGCGGKPACLPANEPSHQDRILLESLFPGRTALMPIAGRQPTETGQRLALALFAYRSGELTRIPWQQYLDPQSTGERR